MIKVKICGITNKEDALAASSAGADAIGLIFTKKSPRYITERTAKKIIPYLGPFLIKVGVFLDQEKERVLTIAQSLKLDVLQFHGKESPSYCNFFKNEFKVIKVFFPQDKPFEKKTSYYNVDAFSFDIKHEEKIEGKNQLPKKDLKEIASLIKKGKKVIISGGLSTKNISYIKTLNPYAVDIASGVERLVGKKDERLLETFIRKVKNEKT